MSMQTLLDCVIAADKEKLLSAIESVQGASGDGCFALSYRMVRRDGEIRWLAVQMHISFAGSDEERHARRTVGAVRDITRRVMSEEALQLASSVYQSSHEGIVVTDENNLIVDINPAFTELTGYTLDEVKGQNPNIFQSGGQQPDTGLNDADIRGKVPVTLADVNRANGLQARLCYPCNED